jgi:agmatine deiminase
MEHHIFLPEFKMSEDAIVFKQFQKLFPSKNIVAVESNEIANEGGVLNCVSWNILKS